MKIASKAGALVLAGLVTLTFLPAGWAADTKPPVMPVKKLTCCQEAKAKGKACTHNCCITARRKGESCVRCNPNKEDLALDKKAGEKKPPLTGAPLAKTDKPDKMDKVEKVESKK